MNTNNQEWEQIFRREGRVFLEPIAEFAAIADEFARHHCHQVLDLGCGTGRHSVALARQGFAVTSVDISLSGLHQTRNWLHETGAEALLLCVDTRAALPFAAASFDAVFTNRVIHHALLAQVRLAIAEMYRVLRPHGLAYITLPTRVEAARSDNEIEPGTFVPQEGQEKGLPHHLFTEAEARQEFSVFTIHEVKELDEGHGLAFLLEKGEPK